MPDPRQDPTYIDLFCGCGGASVGFRKAGFRCLAAFDWDEKAIDCYNANFSTGSARPIGIREDLSTIQTHRDVERFLRKHGILDPHVDAIVGGPPCQSFSSVGQTKVRALIEEDATVRDFWEATHQQRTMLFEVYALFVEVLAPRWLLFENVPTIRSHPTYPLIHHRFNNLRHPDGSELRYTLFPRNYWASDYGVPQRRRRFVMVGHRDDVGIPEWCPPMEVAGPTVEQALSDLPRITHGSRAGRIAYIGPPVTDYQQRMRAEVSAGDSAFITAHVCRSHNPDDIALFNRMAVGAKFSDPEVQGAIREINPNHKLSKYSTEKFRDKLHKLIPTEPAWTVTAHLQKDCYKFIHYAQPRTISVREAARLQSFPDHFRFPDGLGAAFRLIGNAIPPLLAEAFARSFRASDTMMGTAEGRARAVLHNELWGRIAPTLLKSNGRARKSRIPSRTVIAAGYLANEFGMGWTAASSFIGEKADTLKTAFRRTIPGGVLGDLWNEILEVWEDTPRMLELEMEVGPMAAD